MKKWKSILLISAVCALCAFPVQASEVDSAPAIPIPTEGPTVTPQPTVIPPKPAEKNGWVTLSRNRKRYYRNGKLLKGMHKIEGKTYYFFEDSGTMATKWRTIKGKRYYFGTNGVRRQGVQKIGKRWFFFYPNGVMRDKGPVNYKGRTYYLDKNGAIEARKRGSIYYHADGTRMKKAEGYEYETLLTARKIVNQITNSSMSKSQKLETCFRWVMSKYYRIVRPFTKPEGWIAEYANDHFKKGSGDCFSDASAFAYLAKALGYKKVYVCVDDTKTDGTSEGHCWAEINGLVYDPLFAEAKSFSRNYGVTYGVYPLSPLLKEAA